MAGHPPFTTGPWVKHTILILLHFALRLWSKCVSLCPQSCLRNGQQSTKTSNWSKYWEWNTGVCNPNERLYQAHEGARGIEEERAERMCMTKCTGSVVKCCHLRMSVCHTSELTAVTCKTYTRPSQPKFVHKWEKDPVLTEDLLGVDVCWGRRFFFKEVVTGICAVL